MSFFPSSLNRRTRDLLVKWIISSMKSGTVFCYLADGCACWSHAPDNTPTQWICCRMHSCVNDSGEVEGGTQEELPGNKLYEFKGTAVPQCRDGWMTPELSEAVLAYVLSQLSFKGCLPFVPHCLLHTVSSGEEQSWTPCRERLVFMAEGLRLLCTKREWLWDTRTRQSELHTL